MLKRPNIIFSTTRMWNPGDDFIQFGVTRLLQDLMPNFNKIIYNRNPSLFMHKIYLDKPVTFKSGEEALTINLYRTILKNLPSYDNSLHEGFDAGIIDLAVFSGTAEWVREPCSLFYELIHEHRIPTIYLGIGSFEGHTTFPLSQFPEHMREVLRSAKIITVRDDFLRHYLRDYSVIKMPCPALFASLKAKQRTQKKLIGLITQNSNPQKRQIVPPFIQDYSLDLFGQLTKEFECGIICHYIEEVDMLQSEFGDKCEIFYSYDAGDYEEIYDRFDVVVTTRVHGAGIAASLGIPAFVICHSARSSTAEGFLSYMIDPEKESMESVVGRIKGLDVCKRSQEILRHKQTVRSAYHALLRPVLEQLGLI